jgi:hypothetical protein
MLPNLPCTKTESIAHTTSVMSVNVLFPFQLQSPVHTKNKHLPDSPAIKEKRLSGKKKGKKKLTYLWEIGTLNSVLCPTYQPMFHISMLNNCFNKTR